MHSTNYYNTFIEIADDCPVSKGEMPPLKGDKKTIANLQFETLNNNPYKYTSDDILFVVFAIKQGYAKKDLEEERVAYFSKGQPCFRASPLTKQYGWGIHSNEEGKIAMFGKETEQYQKFLQDGSIKKVKAMRNRRK